MNVSANNEGLGEFGFSTLLLKLHREGFSGELTLTTPEVKRKILFAEGVPVFAESNASEEQVLPILLSQGKINNEAVERVEGLVEERGCSEEKALLGLNLLGPKDLLEALQEQTRQRIINCFTLADATVALETRKDSLDRAQAMRLDPLLLIKDGLQGCPEQHLLKAFDSNLDKYPRGGPHVARLLTRLLEKKEQGKSPFSYLNATKTLRELLGDPISKPQLALAWILHHANVFHYLDEPSSIGRLADFTESEIEVLVEGTDAAQESAKKTASPKPGAGKPRKKNVMGSVQLRAQILAKFSTLKDANYYDLLSIDQNATAVLIKKTYFVLAKHYHPDALARQGLEDVKDQAKDVFAAVAKAYATLSDVAKRKEYDASLSSGGSSEDANRVMEAESLYRKSEILIRMGNFKGALDLLKTTVNLWPDEAAYQAALGWVYFKNMPSDRDKALEHLQLALNLDPTHEPALSYKKTIQGNQ